MPKCKEEACETYLTREEAQARDENDKRIRQCAEHSA